MEDKATFAIQMVQAPDIRQPKAKGFQMYFDNGLGISVQFGDGRGDDRYGYLYCNQESVNEDGSVSNTTAEIAVFRDTGDSSGFYPLSTHDDVEGYVTPDKVGKVIGILANEADATRALGPGDPLGLRKILQGDSDGE
jgi:hypothetical protein